MSAGGEFHVSLHHLAPDATRADAKLPDVEFARLSAKKLGALLEAFATLAPQVRYPAAPSLRVRGEHGDFLVQVNAGQVRVTSWSTQANTENLTPDRILALIMGADVADGRGARADGIFGRLPRAGKIAVLAVAIVGSNILTAWFVTRPPPRLPVAVLPEYRPLEPEPGQRALADYAGDYETGRAPGDRQLMIAKDGTLRWRQLGPDGKIADDVALAAQPAQSHGRAVLVASNQGMIELKDPVTLVYFGDTYRRKM